MSLALAGLFRVDASDLIDVAGRSGGTGNAYAQTRQALRALGVRPKWILHTTVYVADARYLPDVDRAYRTFFGQEFPARTVLVAELLEPGAVVEISATTTRQTRRLFGNSFPAQLRTAACQSTILVLPLTFQPLLVK